MILRSLVFVRCPVVVLVFVRCPVVVKGPDVDRELIWQAYRACKRPACRQGLMQPGPSQVVGDQAAISVI
jgi:hypothetical protein